MLNGLVRRAVFAYADRVVSEDVGRRQVHQRREAQRRTQKVREDHEARTVSSNFRKSHAVEARSHNVFAYAEVEIAAAVTALLKIAAVGDAGLGRRSEVRRAADEPRHFLGNG